MGFIFITLVLIMENIVKTVINTDINKFSELLINCAITKGFLVFTIPSA
jgi:hypothetical protein